MPKPYRESEPSKSRRRQRRGTGEIADWSLQDSSLVLKAISAVTKAEGAIRFGYTTQGGAYAIGFLGDGEPYTDYVRPSDDMAEYLNGVIDAWGTSE